MESFEVRKRALFECLTEAEKCLQGTNLDQTKQDANDVGIDEPDSRACRKISKLRGKESIFAKPDRPITKCLKPRQQPDFQRNPHKWTRYSLADADISDRTNSAAAFAFLREIETLKNAKNDPETSNEGDKIVFNKTVRSRLAAEATDPNSDAEKPEMKGSKVVMPEYVVGQKPSRPKKCRSSTDDREKSQAVKLDHLYDE